MRLVLEEDALSDLQDIFDWIAKDNPAAAQRLVNRIFRKLELLLTPGFARMGRLGLDPGTYELIERRYSSSTKFASSTTKSSCSPSFMAHETGAKRAMQATPAACGAGARGRRSRHAAAGRGRSPIHDGAARARGANAARRSSECRRSTGRGR